MRFDLVVRGGTVVDGSGAPRYRADVGVADGRIEAISRDGAALDAATEIDASGKVVAPGFVDSNSHVDWMAPLADRRELLAPMLLQGITTSVGGGCGYSPAPVPPGRAAAIDGLAGFLHDGRFPFAWSSFGEFAAVLEAEPPLLNVAFLVGQNTLRDAVRGLRRGAASADELRAMQGLTREALREGALGLSGNAGMRPGRFAPAAELAALASVVAEEGGVCAVHARSYTASSDAYPPIGAPHNVRAIRDLIAVARDAGARLQISHLLFAGRRTWETAETVLGDLEQARRRGIDIGFDAIPFTVSAGPIELALPGWFVARFPASARRRAAALRFAAEVALQRRAVGIDLEDMRVMASADAVLDGLEGLDFAAAARRLGVAPARAGIELASRSGLRAMVLFDGCSGRGAQDDPLQHVLADPGCAFVTNAVVRSHGARNPAASGAFPRVLGRFSRDLGLFPLEEAVRRMTSHPAQRMGLRRVGTIAPRQAADLVVFDPATVGADDDGRPAGIDAVIVSGAVAASGGRVDHGPGHGRVLRRGA